MSDTVLTLSVPAETLERARAACERDGTDLETELLRRIELIASRDRDREVHSLLVTPDAADRLAELMKDPASGGIEPSAAQMLRHLK